MMWANNFAPKLLRYILLLEKKALVEMLNIGEVSSVYSSHLLREWEPLMFPSQVTKAACIC